MSSGSWLFSFLLVGGGRFVLRRVVYRLRCRGYFLSPAVVVGAGEEGLALARQLQAWHTSGLRLVGFVDDGQPVGAPVLDGLCVLGAVADVPALVEQYGVEEVIVASSGAPRRSLVELACAYALSDRLNIRLSSGLFEILTTGVHIKEMGYVPLICLDKVRLSSFEIALKTLLDYVITLPGLILISPLLLILALAVKLDSPGPVLYRRRVMGKGGQEFDELPQLWNVLRRQMSLVGPRMITRAELEEYGKWDMNLLTVWPGITGLWQISGRSDVTYEERVQLDMHYIRNYTVWLDLQILVRTVPAVLRGKGAY